MITSRNNSTIKAIRSLRNRKDRSETGLLFTEGTHLVGEAVQLGVDVLSIVATPDRVRSGFARDLIHSAVARGAQYIEVSEEVYESLTDSEGRQGLGAVVRQRWHTLEQIRPLPGQIWVAMNAIQYPGNLGTIMRTLDSVGGAGIILLGQSTDPYDPGAVKASMGAIFSLRLARTDLDAFARWKRHHAVHLMAADVYATASYRTVAYPTPTVLLMGAERDGLTAEQRALCDQLVQIPMAGRSDSLNVAVAASVVLYEIFHQTRVALTH